MGSIQQVTIPPDLAEQIDEQVKSGAYASAADVIRAGIEALKEQDSTVEQWLREEVIPGHQEYLADPSTAVSASELLDRLGVDRRR